MFKKPSQPKDPTVLAGQSPNQPNAVPNQLDQPNQSNPTQPNQPNQINPTQTQPNEIQNQPNLSPDLINPPRTEFNEHLFSSYHFVNGNVCQINPSADDLPQYYLYRPNFAAYQHPTNNYFYSTPEDNRKTVPKKEVNPPK